jgi:hypothetical protein
VFGVMMGRVSAEPRSSAVPRPTTPEGTGMGATWTRVVEDMVGRVTGPMKFRLLFQPIMASAFAIAAGLKDAKAGKLPYFWGLFHDPGHRTEMLRSGWKSVGKVFVLAMVLDVVYQMVELHNVYPGEVIFVGFVLAIVPYVLLRGLVNRLASRSRK